jgi:hypothetical protein
MIRCVRIYSINITLSVIMQAAILCIKEEGSTYALIEKLYGRGRMERFGRYIERNKHVPLRPLQD